MGLMTAEQFKGSLKDGRLVYIYGKKVEDVTTDPALKIGVNTAAIDYELAEMSEYRDLAVVEDPDLDGEPVSRYYYTPRNADDLMKRHDLMVEATRYAGGIIPFSHDIAADALNAISITANMIGKPEYVERAENYRKHLKKTDLSSAAAMTDVKGNRVLRPSSPEQAHPDFYVHVVDKNKDGIVVRGAKAHITAAAYLNELMVIPTRNMAEEDKDYAVAFAIPANTKGVKQICHPMRTKLSDTEFPVDHPIRTHTDSLIILDDVFVPWERVFLCGEWQYAMPLVYNFAVLHRHTAASYRIPSSELLLGVAQAMAEYNGIERVSHIREQITDLVMYVNTLKSLSRASCIDFVLHGGIPIPNPVISNIAKYQFASNLHTFIRMVQDIAGGLAATLPSYQDYQNPELKADIDKYLGGKAGIPTEHRLRMFNLIRRMLTFENEVTAVHAEGSLQAQRMTVLAEAQPEIQKYKKLAEMAAGITPS